MRVLVTTKSLFGLVNTWAVSGVRKVDILNRKIVNFLHVRVEDTARNRPSKKNRDNIQMISHLFSLLEVSEYHAWHVPCSKKEHLEEVYDGRCNEMF